MKTPVDDNNFFYLVFFFLAGIKPQADAYILLLCSYIVFVRVPRNFYYDVIYYYIYI